MKTPTDQELGEQTLEAWNPFHHPRTLEAVFNELGPMVVRDYPEEFERRFRLCVEAQTILATRGRPADIEDSTLDGEAFFRFNQDAVAYFVCYDHLRPLARDGVRRTA